MFANGGASFGSAAVDFFWRLRILMALMGHDLRIGIGILGATGYAGAELLRLMLDHPRAEVRALSSRSSAGQSVLEAFPALPPLSLTLDGEAPAPTAWRTRGVEVLFACLPHGTFAALAPAYLASGMRIIDLSADFRLATPAAYARAFGAPHPAPELLARATYGLAEWCDAAQAPLIANPGCYATAILLGIMPVAAAGWLAPSPIIVNAISGVSGAGRGAKLSTSLGECGNSVAPYRTGQAHAHLGEIEQLLARSSAANAVIFNPHLAPMARGIVASIALPLSRPIDLAEARALYADTYGARPFVRLLAPGKLPETRFVRGSNRCDVAVQVVDDGRLLLVFAALDNLLKGAAGQAIQNFNRAHGFDEALGLPRGGWACA